PNEEVRTAIQETRSKKKSERNAAGNAAAAPFVPSDALRQQISAQRRLCALYVYRFEVPSKGPGSPPKLIEFAASILHSAAKIEIKRQFQTASTTGNPEAVYHLFHALCSGARFIETEGKSFKISADAIKQQLTEEFGFEPSRGHLKRDKQASLRGKCADVPVTSNPPLFVMLESQQRGRKLFPGGPEWLNDPKRFYNALIGANGSGGGKRNKSFPYEAFTVLLTNVKSQRNLDKSMYLLQDIYKLRRDEPMTIAQHKELYLQSGQRVVTREPLHVQVTYDEIFNAATNGLDWEVMPDQELLDTLAWPVRECEFCAAPLLMASPAECICGEPYCSDECHAADWSDHQSSCSAVTETLGSSLELTESYWALVLNGSLPSPIPGRVDFVQQFRQGVTEGALRDCDELQFYYDNERTHYAEVVGMLQENYRQAHNERASASVSDDDDDDENDDDSDGGTLPQKTPEEKALAMLFYEVLVQRLQMSTPLPQDSLQRLLFKQAMLSVYKAMSDANPVLSKMSAGPSFKDAEKNINRRIDEEKKKEQPQVRHQAGPVATAAGRMDMRQMFYNF
ncbi:Hypothetical protein, putative, partial [Bodo saltans]